MLKMILCRSENDFTAERMMQNAVLPALYVPVGRLLRDHSPRDLPC